MKKFSSHILSNGMQVLCIPNRSPFVYLAWGCRAGAAQDSIPGIAHLCEHLMFTGTRTYPDYDHVLLQKGAKNNAWTDYDSTVYEIDTTPEQLLPILEIERDRLFHLSADLNLHRFHKEIHVVCNERHESFDTNPMEQWEEQVPELLFGKQHPYGHPIIGFHNSITSITANDVQQFFNTWYRVSNISLCIAGSFSEQQVLEYLEEQWVDNRISVEEPVLQVPAVPHVLRHEMTLHNTSPHLILQWIIPDREDKIAHILAIILRSPQFGILYPDLVLTQSFALDVDVNVETRAALSIFEIRIALKAERYRERVRASIFSALETLALHTPGPERLRKAQKRLRLLWYLESEDLQQYRDLLLSWYMFHTESLEEAILAYRRITVDELQQFAQRLTSTKHLEGSCYASS